MLEDVVQIFVLKGSSDSEEAESELVRLMAVDVPLGLPELGLGLLPLSLAEFEIEDNETKQQHHGISAVRNRN